MEKIIETKKCKNCGINFDITDKDIKFYNKISLVFAWKKFQIPSPTHCPKCRQQRRLTRRNERKLYSRKCDITKKTIISMYSQDKNYIVCDDKIWRTDQIDPMDYWLDFDFSKSFFEQFDQLMHKIPLPSLHQMQNENCILNQCWYTKNSYMSFNTDYSEECYYCTNVVYSKKCIDSFHVDNTEICAYSLDVKKSYKVFYSENIKNSNNIYFSNDLENCSDCFACTGLRNQKYCFFNKQLNKQQYEEEFKKYNLWSKKCLEKIKNKVKEFFVKQPKLAINIENSENCKWNYIYDSKNAINCFDCFDSEDIKYCDTVSELKSSMDFNIWWYNCEMCLDTVSSGDRNYNLLFCANIRGNSQNLLYCNIWANNKNCFGCVWLMNKEYCILNKQYTKEEYNNILPKIIKHMIKTGERWEFLPTAISPFAYNETDAHVIYPMNQKETLNKWYQYKEKDDDISIPIDLSILNSDDIKDNIKDIDNSILDKAILCEVTGRPFRIIKQELDFYRKYSLPVPTKHPDTRHIERISLRNPRKLFDRKCNKCWIEIKTTYSPDRPEKVYCETCYNKEVYW